MQTKLIELLGVSGCLLIVGAAALNIIACAGPMRPLTPPKYYLKQRAALLGKAAAEAQEEEEEEEEKKKEGGSEKRGPPVGDAVLIAMETKVAFQRGRGVWGCPRLVRQIKSRLRDYSRYVCRGSRLTLHAGAPHCLQPITTNTFI